MKLTLLCFIQYRLRVQDRWSDVIWKSLRWILLQVLEGEYALDVLVEFEVFDLEWVDIASVVVLEDIVLLGGQLYLLSIESRSELGCLDSTLSQWIVVLEELAESDPVPHHVVLDLLDEGLDLAGTSEINVEWLVGGLGTGVRIVDDVVAILAVLEEWKVLDVAIVVTVFLHNGSELGIADLNTEESDGLFELFWANLEVVVSIWILEEALSIKSLSSDEVSESIKNLVDVLLILVVWALGTVE